MTKLMGYSFLLHFYMKCIIICWSSITFVSNVQAAGTCRRSDIDALMSLKNGFQDPNTRLSSWKGSYCCEWSGIRCDNISLSVISVDLSGYSLTGSISASLTKLNKSLTYLDLSLNDFNDSPIPKFFGSLSKLRYLNLSLSGVVGMVTTQLGNLSNLEYLDLSTKYRGSIAIGSLEWLAGFGSLKYLAFDNMNMSTIGSKWLETLTKLPRLKELHMSNCGLTGSLSSISTVNFTSLSWIDFSGNDFSKFPNWITSVSSLKILRLENSFLHGKLPSEIGNMTSLTEFDISYNHIEGAIPSSIGKLCNLRVFDVSHNNLTETLPQYLSGCSLGNPLPNLRYLSLKYNKLNGNLPAWLGLLRNLKELRLSQNSFHGPIPSSLGALGGLETLDLSVNNLNGTVPTTFGQLSELFTMNLHSNQLGGMITKAHFTRMTKLTFLGLSSNSLSFRVGSNWVPPFQLHYLGVRKCQLGTTFPTWLKSQKQLSGLDLSNNNISGYVPSWFWDDVAHNLSYLNISFNHLQGSLPNPFPSLGSSFGRVSLSYNRFTGSIPSNIGEKHTSMIFLSMSNNLLTGEIPTSIGLMSLLQSLDLSNNRLSGMIPSNLNLTYLMVLDISNNNLSGSVPSTIWHSQSLTWMHLNNNQLSELIPPTIQNIFNLDTLDLSYNVLSGAIPSWLGQGLRNLRVLNLRSNNFDGDIPPTISKLYSLQVLDLAENKLTGNIPSSLGNLIGLRYPRLLTHYLFDGYKVHQECLTMNVKYILLKYTKVLNVPSNIDLSCNRFSGPFPAGITKLSHLQLLNLSRNEISGRIPESISQMQALESLDISNNKLSGLIPSSITSLTLLEVFDAFNNSLSGTIPFSGQFSTFSNSAFEGNLGLCGLQLNITCSSTNNRGPSTKPSNNVNGYVIMSMGVGFAVGLLFPILLVAANETWRLQYFKFVDLLVNCCCGVETNTYL